MKKTRKAKKESGSATINQRIQMVLDYFYDGSQTALAEKAGISQKNISNYVKEENPTTPGVDKIIAIGMATPELNLRWLLSGEGDIVEAVYAGWQQNTAEAKEGEGEYAAKGDKKGKVDPSSADKYKMQLEACMQENIHLRQRLIDKEKLIKILEKKS